MPDSVKNANSLNTFKHHVKKHYLTWMTYVYMCICVYVCICLSVCGCVYIYIGIYINVFSFDLSILTLFCSCLAFPLIFVLTWGTITKIRRFYPLYTLPAIIDAIHICLQYYFNFNIYILIFQLICFVFLLRLIFRFNKFVIFQFLYSFLWFVFYGEIKLTYLVFR